MTDIQTKYPLVSIISINFNNLEVTAEMLQSLRQISYPNIEIIIIDNASEKERVDILKEQFPEIILIKSHENLGFAGGNNLGIVKSKGKYVLLLNNDTVVHPGFLEPLVTKCEENQQIGAVSPKLYYFDDKDIIQWAGSLKMNKITMRGFSRGTHEKEQGKYEVDWKSYYNHGAAMLVPRKVIEKVGLMAEIYFLYYEELDWGEQIRKNDFEIFYVHNSIVYHKASSTTVANSPLKTYYINRGRLIFMRRNVHGITFLIALIYLVIISIPKNLFTFLSKGKWELTKSYLRASFWNLENIFNNDIHRNKRLQDFS
jgi:GT2 family glycosyltransferase